MPPAASSVGVKRGAKRETALVSYIDLDATMTGNINKHQHKSNKKVARPKFKIERQMSRTVGVAP